MLKKYEELININETIAKDLFIRIDNPWEVLPLISNYILEIISFINDEYIKYDDNVYIHKDAKVSDTFSY